MVNTSLFPSTAIILNQPCTAMLPARRRIGRKRWPRCVTLGHEPLNRQGEKTRKGNNNRQQVEQVGNVEKHGAKLWMLAEKLEKYPAYLPIPDVKRSRGIEMARGSLCKAIMEMVADSIPATGIASELVNATSEEDVYHDDPYRVNEVEVRHSPTEMILLLVFCSRIKLTFLQETSWLLTQTHRPSSLPVSDSDWTIYPR